MRDLWSNRETLYKLLDLDPAEKREWLIDEVQDEEMVNQLSDEGLDDLIYDDAQAWEELDNEEFIETWLPWIEKQTFEGLVILTGAREEVVPAYYLCDTDWRQYDEVGLVEDGGNLLLELDEQEQCQMYAIPTDKEGLEAFIKECMGMAIDDKEDELYWQYENDSEFLRNELLAKSLEAVVDEIRNGEGYHYVDSYCDFAKASQFCKPIEAPVNDATAVNYDESLKESVKLNEKIDSRYIPFFKKYFYNIDIEHSELVPITPKEAKSLPEKPIGELKKDQPWDGLDVNPDPELTPPGGNISKYCVVAIYNGKVYLPYWINPDSEKQVKELGMTPDQLVDNAEELYLLRYEYNFTRRARKEIHRAEDELKRAKDNLAGMKSSRYGESLEEGFGDLDENLKAYISECIDNLIDTYKDKHLDWLQEWLDDPDFGTNDGLDICWTEEMSEDDFDIYDENEDDYLKYAFKYYESKLKKLGLKSSGKTYWQKAWENTVSEDIKIPTELTNGVDPKEVFEELGFEVKTIWLDSKTLDYYAVKKYDHQITDDEFNLVDSRLNEMANTINNGAKWGDYVLGKYDGKAYFVIQVIDYWNQESAQYQFVLGRLNIKGNFRNESLKEPKNLKEDWEDYCYTALESFISHLDPNILADKIHSADNEEDLAAWLCDEVFQDDYYGAEPEVSHACYDVAYDILYDSDMDESLEEPVSEAINVDKTNYKDLQDELVELKDYYEYMGPDGFYAIPLKQFAVEFPLFYDLILMSFVTEYLDIDVETEDPDELENSWSMGELILPEDWPALFKGADDGIHRATSTTKHGDPRKKQQWDAVYPQFLKGFEKA